MCCSGVVTVTAHFSILQSLLFYTPYYFFLSALREKEKKSTFLTSYLTICPCPSILGIAFKLLSAFDKIPHSDDGKYFCDMASFTKAGTLEQQ